MDLTISIIGHSSEELLKQCIDSIYENIKNKILFEIYVVDNKGIIDSFNKIKDQYYGLKFIKNTRLLGFSANHNKVIKMAKGRYILILNDDTILQSGNLSEMIKFMDKNPNIGIAGCKTFLNDRVIQKTCGRFPRFWGEFFHLTIGQILPWRISYMKWKQMHDFSYDFVRCVDWISGVFFLIKKEVVEKIGLLDEGFFMYYEDAEYCYRLNKNTNLKVLYNPNCKIVHYHGQSLKKNKVGYKAFIYNLDSSFHYFKVTKGKIISSIFKMFVFSSHNIIWILALICNLLTLKKIGKCVNLHKKFREVVLHYRYDHQF